VQQDSGSAGLKRTLEPAGSLLSDDAMTDDDQMEA
jgi:hypothetical protein